MKKGFIWGNRSQNGKESNISKNSIKIAKGFTLVELIVVLVILAILAAIAVPTFISFIDKAKEKKVQMAGQKALAAAQSSLSDIYADAGNRFSPEKRISTRTLADVDNDENNSDTEFIIWNEKKLWDGHTVAVAENIGSYTVSKALYREGNLFAAYNGKVWEVFDKKDKALTWLNIGDSSNDLTENVIYLWPYAQDLAYLDTITPADDPDGPGKDAVIKEVTLKLPRTTLSHVFFSKEGRTSNSGKESVTVVFWKESADSPEVNSYWTIDGNNKNLFKVDEYNTYWINIVNSENHTYTMKGWKRELEDGTSWQTQDISKNALQGYIFAQAEKKFTFEAIVEDDIFVPKIATIDKLKFQSVIGSQSISAVTKTTGDVGGNYTEDMMAGLEAVRVDEQRADEGGKVYAWVRGGTLNWWTDATTVYLPEDCSNFFGERSVASFDFSEFDVSRITSMEKFFYKDEALTNVTFGNNFHADGLTTVFSMFDGCKNLASVDLEKLNAEGGSLTNVSYMFKECEKLPAISFSDGFHTENATSWDAMFQGCKATTINVTALKTDSATSMISIFENCSNVQKLNISGWNMSGVAKLNNAFKGDTALTDITFATECNLDACTDMESAFEGCSAVKNDFSEIKPTSKLTNMKNLFHGCSSVPTFNIKEWDVSGVESMDSVFEGCANAKTIDLSKWNTAKLTSLNKTFFGCTNVEKIDMSNWKMEKVTTLEKTFSGLAKLQKVELGDTGWRLNACTSLKSTFESCNSLNQSFDKLYTTTALKDMSYTFSRCRVLTDLDLKNVNVQGVTSLKSTFAYCEKLQTINHSTWDTASLTDMEGVFNTCEALKNLDLSTWNVSGVTTMKDSFNSCKDLETINVSTWNTASLTNLDSAFFDCRSLENIDMRTWNMSQVTNASNLFCNNSELTKIQMGTGWDMSNCTEMNSTFAQCSKLNQDFREISTSDKLKNVGYIFDGMSSVTRLDLRNWDLRGVTDNCTDAFKDCSSLRRVYADRDKCFVAENEQAYDMFSGCTSLEGREGTTLANNDGKIIAQYAWVDGALKDGTPQVGYFTDKPTAAKLKALGQYWVRDNVKINGNTQVNNDKINSISRNETLTEEQVLAIAGVKELSDPDFTEGYPVYFWIDPNKDVHWWSEADNVLAHENATKMFYSWKIAQISLEDLDLSLVENLSEFFRYDGNLTSVDMSAYTLENATDMTAMFRECANLQTVKMSVDTTNLPSDCSLSNLFKSDISLVNADITVTGGKVSSLESMFSGCTSLTNVDNVSLDTSNSSGVTVKNMFTGCTGFTNLSLDQDRFKIENVTTLEAMFSNCTNLTDLSFYVSTKPGSTSVTIKDLFTGTTKLANLTINGSGEGISSTNQMFKGRTNLRNVDMGNFTLSSVTNMEYMFQNCTGLQSASLYVDTTKNTSDCTLSNLFRSDTSLVEANVTVVGGKINNLDNMFGGCTALKNVDNVYLDTSKSSGTTLKYTFSGCTGLTKLSLDQEHFKLENVTSFDHMFSDCINLTDLSFYASTKAGSTGVTFTNIFSGTNNLENLTIEGRGEGITSIAYMFKGRTALNTVNMGEFELSSITNLQEAFRDCSGLTSASLSIDTSDSTSDVSMCRMFYACISLEKVQIVGKWDNVTSIESMFGVNKNQVSNLTTIDFGETVDMRNLKTAKHLFENVSNQQNANRLFSAFAETFAVWDLNDIFEKRDNNSATYTNRISTVNTIFDGKSVTNKNGKVYAVQDNKYFCNHL